MKKLLTVGTISLIIVPVLAAAQVPTRVELNTQYIGNTNTSDTEIRDISRNPDSTATDGVEPDEIDVSIEQTNTGVEPDEIDFMEPDDETVDFNVEREMKESGEKGGTEDINIGIGEMQGDEEPDDSEWRPVRILAPTEDDVISIDPELLERLSERGEDIDPRKSFISNGTLYSVSGYMKLGDIKGESQESQSNNSNSNSNSNTNSGGGKGKSKGKIEYSWKIEEGESYHRPRDIVVVGSKIKENAETADQDLDNCDDSREACDPETVLTDEQLEEFLRRSVNEYDELEETRVDENQIHMITRQPGRLLWIFPVSLKQEVMISTDVETLGRVKVKLPWWSFLVAKSVSPGDLEEQVDGQVDAADYAIWRAVDTEPETDNERTFPVEIVSLNYAHIVAVMHEAAMNSIRNIK